MDVYPVPDASDTFSAAVFTNQLAFAGISYVKSDAHIARRTERNITLHPACYYKIAYQLSGKTSIKQDGKTCLLHPGMLTLYDTTRPYELTFIEQSESYVALIPQSEVAIDPALVKRITARAIVESSTATICFIALLEQLSIERLSPGSATAFHLARSLTELLTVIILSEYSRLYTTDSPNEELLASLKRYARSHLSNPRLCINDIANAHYISSRTVQRLFRADHTTFTEWLRTERLTTARQRLFDSPEPITTIAYDCGFVSLSHFSRAFKDHFGVSARETRSQAAESHR